jgi:hypothetical protein
MRRRVAVTLLTFAAVIFATNGAKAQSVAPQQTPSDSAQTASNSMTATASSPATAPAKKVWTNEDVGDLRGRSAISTVGVANSKPAKQNNQKVANPETIKSYQTRILALQAKLPDLDQKIADLQGVLSGSTVNQTRHATGAKIDDWHDELAKLQQQRTDTADRISTLQDQARHAGVPENQIPE